MIVINIQTEAINSMLFKEKKGVEIKNSTICKNES